MSFQRWIAQNMYAESVPHRCLAFFFKITIEGSLSLMLALVFTVPLHLVFVFANLQIPYLPKNTVALWFLLSMGVLRKAWCLTSQSR